MAIDNLIQILVTVTVIELMVSIGLSATFAELGAVGKQRRLMIQALLANYFCVPAAAVILLLLFQAQSMVAAGFLIAAVCPGAPYGPPFTALARGNVPVSVGLMVALTASSAILAPPLLQWLLPLVTTGSETPPIDAAKIVGALFVVQLLPLIAGLMLRHWFPKAALRVLRPANLLSMVLTLALIGLIVVVHFRILLDIPLRGFLGMVALVATALAVGWHLGTPGASNRRAMAITTAVRNVGVALAIAAGSFAGTAAVTATLAFALFQTITVALVALGWGRLAPGTSQRLLLE